LRQSNRAAIVAKAIKAEKSVDDLLTEHLQAAEEHLVEALKLFLRQKPVTRRAGYQKSLERAQEGVTALLREELVQKRGHMTPKTGKVKLR
jgi:hypothetical protein